MSGKAENQGSAGFDIRKEVITGVDELQLIYLDPGASLERENTDGWEVVIHEGTYKTAFISLNGEETKISNKTVSTMTLLLIKGHKPYEYQELASLFEKFGFSVQHGSLTLCD